MITPNYFPFALTNPFDPPIGPFNSTVTGLTPGTQWCVRYSLHLDGLECCSEVKCFEVPQCTTTHVVPCDSNCDGFSTVGDIGAFVLALTDPAQYAIDYPGCPEGNSDVNNDGFVNVGDIGLFVLSLID